MFVGTFAVSEGDLAEGWALAKQQSRLRSHLWGCPRIPSSGCQELVNLERARFFQGWGAECQKPSGQVDRCVCSICLVRGAWQMECRDQAAENLDQFQTAPFPRLKAEHFLRAAVEPGAQGAPRWRKFHWNLTQSLVSLAWGIVGPTEHSLA